MRYHRTSKNIADNLAYVGDIDKKAFVKQVDLPFEGCIFPIASDASFYWHIKHNFTGSVPSI